MRSELTAYFSDTHETTGLLVAEAPTGYGKTYETVHAIYQYIRNGGKAQVLFVTNLLKNLPEDEFRRVYRQDGREAEFEKEVLKLSSNESVVEDVILQVEVPLEFQTDAYHALKKACEKRIYFQEQGGDAASEMVRFLENSIRTDLEPKFRHELEYHLRKAFPQGSGQRRKAVRSQKRYQWMAKFYPAIFWSEYKVILLSVYKLMVRNTPLVEHSFDCLSDRMIKGRIVCIDEFDASRSAVLDRLIDDALKPKEDYLRLFLQVYRGIITHKSSKELERIRKNFENGRGTTWKDLTQQAKLIYQEGALYYSMKTVDTGVDQGRNFLFHDTSYHTVLDGRRTHIRMERSDEHQQLQLHFETKAEYDAHQGESPIAVQTLLRRIHGIGCFSSGRRVLNPLAQTALRQSASVHGQITRDVLQAVGRIGRTFLKRPVVYLFTTEKTLGDFGSRVSGKPPVKPGNAGVEPGTVRTAAKGGAGRRRSERGGA